MASALAFHRGGVFRYPLSSSLLLTIILLAATFRRPFFVSSFSIVVAGWSPSPRIFHGTARLGMATTTEAASVAMAPPVARRDPDRCVWAGVAPPGWDPALPRQGETSKEPLLDPPIAVPDPYGWLRDDKRTNPDVIAHLEAENEYTKSVAGRFQDTLVPQLYDEMVGAIQETDHTTPRPHGDYVYYTRTYKGRSYTTHCRAPRNATRQWNEAMTMTDEQRSALPVMEGEQVTLDVNQLAEGQKYCATGAVKISPSHRYLAYSVDFTGNEICQLYIKDLLSSSGGDNIVHHDPTLDISGSLVWGGDDTTIYFLKQDAAQRPYQAYRRTFASSSDYTSFADEMLFEERNDLFWLGISKSLDGRYLFIESSSKETSEIHFVDLLATTSSPLQCVAKRREKVMYEVEHRLGRWWIASNVDSRPNLALFTAPAIADSQDEWQLVQRGSDGTPLFDGNALLPLDGVECFQNHVVASGRQGGLPAIWILGDIMNQSSDDGSVPEKTTTTVGRVERLTFPEDAHDCGLDRHYEFATQSMVVQYDSLVTPPQSIEIDLDDTTTRKVLKERNVPGYDKEQYGCERTMVLSRDGTTQIPVSILYRRDLMERHQNDAMPLPLHLYGYGSYGACMEASFVASRLPLLDRGMVYVLAHVRGGGEMGRTWYEEPNGAKYLCKKNTFNDFCDIAHWLIHTRKLTSAEKMSCEGRSAGGLLIGGSINQAPHLFRVAVLGVPFVDVVPTMTDASIVSIVFLAVVTADKNPTKSSNNHAFFPLGTP
jgi:oligopeptidase B